MNILIRTESIRNTSNLLCIDDNDVFRGECTLEDFIEAMTDDDTREFDGYVFYCVDKFLLFSNFLPAKK